MVEIQVMMIIGQLGSDTSVLAVCIRRNFCHKILSNIIEKLTMSDMAQYWLQRAAKSLTKHLHGAH